MNELSMPLIAIVGIICGACGTTLIGYRIMQRVYRVGFERGTIHRRMMEH